MVAVIASSCPQPVDPADALAVPPGIPVEHAVGGEAAQVEVQVVLPGEADAAVGLQAHLRNLRAGVADIGLGDARDLRRGRTTVGDGLRGGRRTRGAHLDPETDVGEDVLERLERPDRATERDARLRVLNRDLGELAHRADRLGEGERDRHVELGVDARLGAAARAEHRAVREHDVVEAHVGEATGEVESVERHDRDARRLRVDDELGDPLRRRRR